MTAEELMQVMEGFCPECQDETIVALELVVSDQDEYESECDSLSAGEGWMWNEINYRPEMAEGDGGTSRIEMYGCSECQREYYAEQNMFGDWRVTE